jgi:glycosyltransferase involved in cell wall biosynthesis
MKIFAFAIGARDRASSRLRVWDHLDWLSAQGHRVHADSLAGPGTKRADLRFLARMALRYPRWLFRFFWSDAVLVQESLELWPAILLKNFGKSRTLLFDFSDAVDRIGHGFRRRLRRKMFELVVRRADAVVMENGAYASLLAAHSQRCAQFYGPVDASRYGASRERLRARAAENGPLRIGWTGSPGTLSFIAPLLPIIDELAQETPIELVLMGVDSVDYRFSSASLVTLDWSEEAEFDLVPTFDLGLFRLDGSEDSRWRGAGKLFIYMAAGVPFVASDIGIAKAVMDETGIGFRVSDDGRWLEVLRTAAGDASARQAFAAQSLAFARDKLSYERYREQIKGRLEGIRAKADRDHD